MSSLSTDLEVDESVVLSLYPVLDFVPALIPPCYSGSLHEYLSIIMMEQKESGIKLKFMMNK